MSGQPFEEAYANVMDHGATGLGLVDDTSAIQDALRTTSAAVKFDADKMAFFGTQAVTVGATYTFDDSDTRSLTHTNIHSVLSTLLTDLANLGLIKKS